MKINSIMYQKTMIMNKREMTGNYQKIKMLKINILTISLLRFVKIWFIIVNLAKQTIPI